jgi:DNA polymerase III delta prime subunit
LHHFYRRLPIWVKTRRERRDLTEISFRATLLTPLEGKGAAQVFASLQVLSERLRSTGYIVDSNAATTIYLASRLHKPLLLEGPAGSGKTQLAYAVAEAANTTVERLQCYEGINEEKAIGKFDEPLQRLCVELKSKSNSVDWESLQIELHGRQFFIAGPLLSALEYEKPCVLLIDELDKVDHAFEAQAFKRACSCFGLGRYLYYFAGVWVDLDVRKRPKSLPRLPAWATPEGWRAGLRPSQNEYQTRTSQPESKNGNSVTNSGKGKTDALLVSQIEAMAEPLGRGLYRGLLKTVARVWQPAQITDLDLMKKVLEYMQAAKRGLRRLDQALNQADSEAMAAVLGSMSLRSFEQVNSLECLKQVVLAVEARVKRVNL